MFRQILVLGYIAFPFFPRGPRRIIPNPTFKEIPEMSDEKSILSMTVPELRELARSRGIEKTARLTKAALLELLGAADAPGEGSGKEQPGEKQAEDNTAEEKQESPEKDRSGEKKPKNRSPKDNSGRYARLKDSIDDSYELSGPVTVMPEGYGLLKTPEMTSKEEYVYVSASQVQKFRLLSGYEISGKVRPPKPGETYSAMLFLESVNGVPTQQILEEEKKKMGQDNSRDMSVYEKSHSGILELSSDGFGFLRKNNYLSGDDDIYVAPTIIRKYRLKSGDWVTGRIRTGGENERYDALLYVEKVNGLDPETIVGRSDFEKLLPVFPDEQIVLSSGPRPVSVRLLDMFVPIGKGQRGLIVSPPKAGKTVLLKEIARSIRANYPDITLIILLVDERPEEVTDMQRSVDCDVIYSTFDQKPANHVKAAEMVLDRAKRLVESGMDVAVLVDSITRLARANNMVVASSGRTLSGGLDPESLYFPKKFFGAARNIEGGGSLTILATALIDTGSRMDDVIYEEFKGTGNMEVHLSRDLSEARIFPAIDIQRSGTRREDLLLSPDVLDVQYAIRRSFAGVGVTQFAEKVIAQMSRTESNDELVEKVRKTMDRKKSE